MEGDRSVTFIAPVAIKATTQFILIPAAPFFQDSRIFPSLLEKITELDRAAKVKKYLEKKRKRNFARHIRYECRRTLAVSRTRQNGRFIKSNSRKSTEDEETMFISEKVPCEAI
jgi:hypothetical protein